MDTNGDGVVSDLDDPYAPYYPGDAYVDWVGMSVRAWPQGTEKARRCGCRSCGCCTAHSARRHARLFAGLAAPGQATLLGGRPHVRACARWGHGTASRAILAHAASCTSGGVRAGVPCRRHGPGQRQRVRRQHLARPARVQQPGALQQRVGLGCGRVWRTRVPGPGGVLLADAHGRWPRSKLSLEQLVQSCCEGFPPHICPV
jgi:hypothetical protein